MHKKYVVMITFLLAPALCTATDGDEAIDALRKRIQELCGSYGVKLKIQDGEVEMPQGTPSHVRKAIFKALSATTESVVHEEYAAGTASLDAALEQLTPKALGRELTVAENNERKKILQAKLKRNLRQRRTGGASGVRRVRN